MSEYSVGATAPPFHPNCVDGSIIPCFEDDFAIDGSPISENMSFEEWEEEYVKSPSNGAQFASGVSNDWNGASPTQHSQEELDELARYAEEHGIRLYRRQQFDGDISLLKSQIDVIERIRNDFKREISPSNC